MVKMSQLARYCGLFFTAPRSALLQIKFVFQFSIVSFSKFALFLAAPASSTDFIIHELCSTMLRAFLNQSRACSGWFSFFYSFWWLWEVGLLWLSLFALLANGSDFLDVHIVYQLQLLVDSFQRKLKHLMGL